MNTCYLTTMISGRDHAVSSFLTKWSAVIFFKSFHTIHGVLEARILKWFTIPFFSGPRFVRTLHHEPSILGGPARHVTERHWFTQGNDPYDHLGWLSDCGFHSVRLKFLYLLSALWWMGMRGFCKLHYGRDWLLGKLRMGEFIHMIIISTTKGKNH